MDFRKTFFLLPNLFTLGGLFCGFYAITLCARLGDEGADQDVLYKAALAILAGLFFDATDGRIARLTKTQSELGLHLDSLADCVTFGAAPALLVYRFGLEDLGRAGMMIAFLFLAAGALRLARFNVLSLREPEGKKPGKYMLGLPIPMAAAAIVGLVLVNRAVEISKPVDRAGIAVVVVVLSYLMISRVRFRSMKDVKFNRRTVGGLVLFVGLVVLLLARVRAPAVFMLLMATYIVLGLLEEVLLYRRRKVEEARNAAESEEREVLAELGADEAETDAGIR